MRGQESGSEHEHAAGDPAAPVTPPPSFGQPSPHAPRIDLTGDDQPYDPPSWPEHPPGATQPWTVPADGGAAPYDWFSEPEDDLLCARPAVRPHVPWDGSPPSPRAGGPASWPPSPEPSPSAETTRPAPWAHSTVPSGSPEAPGPAPWAPPAAVADSPETSVSDPWASPLGPSGPPETAGATPWATPPGSPAVSPGPPGSPAGAWGEATVPLDGAALSTAPIVPGAPPWQPPPAFTAAAAGMQVWPSSAADAHGAPPWPAATGEPVWTDAEETAPRPAEPGDVPVWPPSAIPHGGSGESTVKIHAAGPAAPPHREQADHPAASEPDGSGLTEQATPAGPAAGGAVPAGMYAPGPVPGTTPPSAPSPSSASPAAPGRTPGALPEAERSPEPVPSPASEAGHASGAAASPAPEAGHTADSVSSPGVEHSAGPPLPRRRPQSFSQATANSPGFSRQPARPPSPQDPSPTPAQGTAPAQEQSPEPAPQPGTPAQPTGPALTAQGPLPRSEPMPQTPVPPTPGSPFPPADRGAPAPLRASREQPASPDDIPVLSVSFPPAPPPSSAAPPAPSTEAEPSGPPTPVSGEVVPRGPFTPVSAAVVKATPAPPPPAAGRSRGGTLLIAAVVMLVIGGIGTGSFLAYRSFTAKQVASAPRPLPSPLDFTEEPTTPTEPDPVNTEMLNSERTDPGKMSVADAFPKKVTVGGITFARVRTDLTTKCQEAAAGRFAGMLKSQDCRQVLRATYVDGDRRYAVTTGVAMLPTRESAVAADRAKDLNDNVWFRGLPGSPGSGAERVHIAGGYAAGLVWGRYIVFSYATFGDGHTPTSKERALGRISGAFRDETAKAVERRVTN